MHTVFLVIPSTAANGASSERLQNSAYGNEEDIKTMLDYFDKFTKPVFKDSNENSYIKFGSMGCNDPRVKIRRGQLQLTGYVIPMPHFQYINSVLPCCE